MKKTLPKWSPYSLWLGQCPRRFWLYQTKKLTPPPNCREVLGNILHEEISKVLARGNPLLLDELTKPALESIANSAAIHKWSEAIEADLSLTAKICLKNFYQKYILEKQIQNTLATESRLVIRMTNQGQPAKSKGRLPSYELFGRSDEIRKEKEKLIIRDFKLSYKNSQEAQLRRKIQFSLYHACLRFVNHPEIYALGPPELKGQPLPAEISCQVFDLSSGRIWFEETMSLVHLHILVKSTELKVLARSQGYERQFCPNCPYRSICYNPDAAGKEWHRTFQNQKTNMQLTLFDPPD